MKGGQHYLTKWSPYLYTFKYLLYNDDESLISINPLDMTLLLRYDVTFTHC